MSTLPFARIRRAAVAAALAAVGIVAAASSPARAAIVLNFSQPVYNASVNSVVDVPVFLTETGTTFLNTEGLNGGGLVLSFNTAPRATSPAEVISISTNPSTDPALDLVVSSITLATPSTTGTASLKFSQFIDPPLSAGGTSRVLVGTFRFRTGTANPDVTNLSLALASPGNQFVTGTGRVLDSQITFGTGQIVIGTTAAAPEPGTFVMLATAFPLLTGYFLVSKARRPRNPS